MDCLFGGSALDAGSHGVPIVLPKMYGLVLLVAIATKFLLLWMAMNVNKARKKYDVKYPAMYSDKSEMFNCIQRAHQNTLEIYVQFLVVLLIGGLEMPVVAALSGVTWFIGRIAYAQGYYTGNPEKRYGGAASYVGYIGLYVLLFASCKFAIRLAMQ